MKNLFKKILFGFVNIASATSSAGAATQPADWYSDQTITAHLSESVSTFLGNTSGNYFFPPTLLATDNVSKALTGVPAPAVTLKDGSQLLSSHVPGNDHQQAVLVVDGLYNVLYAAIFHRDCHVDQTPKPKLAAYLKDHPEATPIACYKRYVLTIFTRTALSSDATAAFAHWLQSQFDDKVRTEVVVLK